jgi:ribosomal protein L11 methyltransferase
MRGRAVDIGTGSGILALAAAKMGSSPILALDTDPCARQETRANIALNRLEGCIRVGDQSFATLADSYRLVMANLRVPTLKEMLPWARKHLHAEGAVVVSGYLKEESVRMEALLKAAGFIRCWGGTEKRWAGGCFKRSGV